MNEKLSRWDVAYALNMAVACLVSYWVATSTLSGRVDKPSELLGGMWAAIATVFVFRDSRERTRSAAISRLIATCVSLVLCLLYLLCFPFTPWGMAVLIGIGTVVLDVFDRRDDIITAAITTVVVMVVAAISPRNAWHQPLLRLGDTLVGIVVGIAFRWFASYLQRRAAGTSGRRTIA